MEVRDESNENKLIKALSLGESRATEKAGKGYVPSPNGVHLKGS